MMGNESSQINRLNIDDKATEVTDFWSHHQAHNYDSTNFFSLVYDGSVSVFIGKPVLGPLWNTSMPLEKFTQNILKYRHPYILRYLSSWKQKSTYHLVTEHVRPLAQVLSSQTPLQICVGLNAVLEALVFLHEQGSTSHNNISVSSVYLSGDGQWKLGGLEYLCPFTELTPAYLKQARIHRYDKAVDPNEELYKVTSRVDQYGFAVLVDDVFKGHKDEDVPHLKEFKKYCRDMLQHTEPLKRPNLSEVLKHDFFNHNFISIYKFLNILPLKSDEEKCQFFSNILTNLKKYDEETVAKQFGGLLLSRHTLLDQTARECVLPYILKPRKEMPQNREQAGYFSMGIFKEHIKPRLIQLFGVRDSQIRMILISHFLKFVHVFTRDELSLLILPELLLGIKDVNDNLVASTLVCLSELVPILGADTVVGGKRTKIFTDGRPNSKIASLPMATKSTETLTSSTTLYNLEEAIPMLEQTIILNERPTPVGGESVESDDHQINISEFNSNVIELQEAKSEDEWDDWDNTKHQLVLEKTNAQRIGIDEFSPTLTESGSTEVLDIENAIIDSTLFEKAALHAKKNILDITELDIKNQKIELPKKQDEYDFFADMTPVIEKQEIAVVASNPQSNFSSKLNFTPDENLGDDEGWGDSWND